MSAYPYTQADETPEIDSLSTDYYELVAVRAEKDSRRSLILKSIQGYAWIPCPTLDELDKEISEIDAEIERITDDLAARYERQSVAAMADSISANPCSWDF